MYIYKGKEYCIMDRYLIFVTNGILSPLSTFDKFYNGMAIELSKEEAKRLVEKLNSEERRKILYNERKRLLKIQA